MCTVGCAAGSSRCGRGSRLGFRRGIWQEYIKVIAEITFRKTYIVGALNEDDVQETVSKLLKETTRNDLDDGWNIIEKEVRDVSTLE